MNNGKPKGIILLGPTASGKSRLAINMAQEFNGVIINADSMQVYRNFPILSASPSSKDFEDCPHQLYGIFDLEKNESCSVSTWVALAKDVIEKTLRQRKLPILVGGTGFYIKGLLEGLSPIPPIPNTLRKAVSKALQNQPQRDALYKHLQKADPASKIHIGDTQRLTRALEVLIQTQKPLSFWNKQPQKPCIDMDFCIVTLMPQREKLYETINLRAEDMIKQGALDEVNRFHNKTMKVPIIGYQDIQDYLEGKIPHDAMVEKIQQKTRNYAKRQVTWIRHQIQSHLVIESQKAPLF